MDRSKPHRDSALNMVLCECLCFVMVPGSEQRAGAGGQVSATLQKCIEPVVMLMTMVRDDPRLRAEAGTDGWV